MPRFLSSILNHHWERKLLALTILLLGGLFFTWEVILETPPEPAPRQVTLPAPPHLFDWDTDMPEFLMPNDTDATDNPFTTSFPLAKPAPAPEPRVTEPVAPPPPPQELPPPPPPQRTIVITFNGLRTALSGTVFAILEVADSENGVSTAYAKQGDALDGGLIIQDVSEKEIRVSQDITEEPRVIPYGDTQIFTLAPKE